MAFLANFWEWPNHNEVALYEFYMADSTCKLVVLSSSGKILTSTITTAEYLDWAQDISV